VLRVRKEQVVCLSRCIEEKLVVKRDVLKRWKVVAEERMQERWNVKAGWW
jgi:hypothetical protein